MKAVFLDIDGTILDANAGMTDISDKTKYAIEQLRKNGHKVFLCSGRHMPIINREILKPTYDGYVLANGAFSYCDGKVVHEVLFDLEIIDNIISICKKNDIVYYFEDFDYAYTGNLKDERHLKFVSDWNVPDCFIEERNFKDKHINIGMLGFGNMQDYQKLADIAPDKINLVLHNNSMSCDINLKNIDKSYGIKQIVKKLNIDIKDTIAFGDGLNDLEMLSYVNEGVAMANARKELKQLAKYHTSSVLEDGVYEYLVKINLIEPMK